MLLIDERIGSEDLLLPLQRSGVPCDLTHLQFADVAFIGRGLDEKDLYIGIELKRTSDLITSMYSARFSGHQLPGLQRTYDRAWLLTEGIWRTGDEGVLEEFRGTWRPVTGGAKRRVMTADVESWILSQTIRGGIAHWHCPTRRDTLRFLSVVFHWWTHKALDDHRSHQAIYLPPPDRMLLTEPSTFVKMASCIPGVGWDKAMKLQDVCGGSLRTLLTMTAEDLQEIPTFGKKTAASILSAIDAIES